MKAELFTYEVGIKGYFIYYKGEMVGGKASIVEPKVPNNLMELGKLAETDIKALCEGNGRPDMAAVCAEIDCRCHGCENCIPLRSMLISTH